MAGSQKKEISNPKGLSVGESMALPSSDRCGHSLIHPITRPFVSLQLDDSRGESIIEFGGVLRVHQ